MKGLLLKDIYQMIRYCKIFLIIAVLFVFLAFYDQSNLFFLFFLGIIGGMLPMNLLAYDEHDKWEVYACTLPYSRAQIVSVKYLIGLIIGVGLTIIAAVLMVLLPDFRGIFWDFLLILLCMTLMISGIVLPLVFKFGAAKGRLVYYAIFGACFAISFIVAKIKESLYVAYTIDITLGNAVIAAVIFYILSWLLAVRFYKKRQF